MPNFETVEVTTDVLIIGGGMAACGAAVEAAHWAKKHGIKVTLVDKAAMDRSGAVAMGLSAINLYLGIAEGQNTCMDYVEYVRNDLMGIARDDLVYDIARHVDSTVHLFERWGLPIWKAEDGSYLRESGRWQLMINGESYKIIVAEAAKNALGKENIYERVFVVEPLVDGDRIAGAVGFSTREEKVYVFRAKAVLCAMGGAVGVFRPRSTGEGLGRSWYPPFSTGSSAYFTIKAGAEMTCQEVRFIPVRFKDAYGPVGAWFLLFKSTATNANGEVYMQTNAEELKKWGRFGSVKPMPANLRNWLGMIDVAAGKGPIYMQTAEAIQRLAAKYEGDEKAFKKKMKQLEAEAWEDFLDMTIAQALLWAACNIEPEVKPSEIAAAEPYFIGSHSGASGAWVSGSPDIAPAEYFWGYACMTTVKGLFAAGDASGASSHKFSSGSHAEGRIAGKWICKYVLDNPELPNVDAAEVEAIKERIVRPIKLFEEFSGYGTTPEINPNYILPKQYMFRVQKIMDEYAGGYTSNFTTSKALLEKGLEYLQLLKEDSEKLAARDLHELMRCYENIHRTWQAEAHIRSVLFREETRWPGYYFRADKPSLDDSWEVFVNCKYDRATGNWEVFKKPIIRL
ncbi:adenylyl-sulfate reductase subunit alpha [Desulforudis sp. 1088]|uniref:adenylyl-sulfate reductase subunit alpha n=1 Tax=unclassified Candidatus Desulforudis TaxID=2635950 RepID=UPI003480FCD4